MEILQPNPERMLERFSKEEEKSLYNLIEANEYRSQIEHELAVIGPGIITLLDEHSIKIKSLGASARIEEYSKTMERFGTKLPPGVQGLFVPFDKALYILAPQPGVVVHELGHAIDYCLAKDPIPAWFKIEDVRNYKLSDIQGIKPFLTLQSQDVLNSLRGSGIAPSLYGSTSPQEFFAEAVRSYCNVNETGSLWDEISATKFRCTNRESYTHIANIFLKYNGRKFEGLRFAKLDSQ